MTDALRTRIARILYSQNAYEDWNGNEMTWEETSQAYRECWLHDADVLIRELGLRKQSQTGEIVNLIEGDGINYGRHRYVTEWFPSREPRSAEKLGLTGDGK